MNTVLVYREALLPLSETFIRLQVQCMSRWRPVLFGGSRVAGGLGLEGVTSEAVSEQRPSPLFKAKRQFFRHLGMADPGYLRRARRHAPDVIHVHFGTDALFAAPLAERMGVPLVVTLHGYDANVYPACYEAGELGHFFKRYPREIRKLAEHDHVHFVAVAGAVRETAVSQLKLPADKIHVIHLGVDVDTFAPGPVPVTERDPHVLFVGRMIEKKAPEVLVRAVAAARNRVPGLRATLIGDGPLLQPMKTLAGALGAPVHFMGAQPPEVVRQMMHESRLFCLPSITAGNGDAEGLPIVVLEAQACGVPVLTSARGGRDEGIWPGVTGFAFEEGQVGQLTDLLVNHLPDRERLAEMSRAAPLFIREHHNARLCTSQLEDLYDKVVRA